MDQDAQEHGERLQGLHNQLGAGKKMEDSTSRMEEQIKRNKDKVDRVVTEMRDDLEKKIFTAVGTMVQANTELARSLETGTMRSDDQIGTLNTMCEKIFATNVLLTELTDMRETHNSIADGLCSNIEATLTKTLQEKFQHIFANFRDFKEQQRETDSRFNHVRANNLETSREIKTSEEHLTNMLNLYVFQSTFEDKMKEKANGDDVQNLREQVSQFAKADEVSA